ncbi:MAG TPA: DUF3108 domain-containing protein [Trueperaceae bacterium]
MPVEVCSYRLTFRGAPVGTHVLRTEQKGQTAHLEGRLMLQGSLGQSTTTQTSRFHRGRRLSLGFQESTERRGEKRSYEVVFDAGQGIVKASRGQGDQASVPYIRPYRDPLGLLFELRGLEPGGEPAHFPMLGKDVTAIHLGTTELDTALGRRAAHAYKLHPGPAYVYIDVEEPNVILQMSQRVEGQVLEALLVKVAQEDEMPVREAERPRSGRRRRRRRRRR